MEKAIMGKKIGMTQIFNESGKLIPVTVVEAGPCTIVQLKTDENDGYVAVQVGYAEIKEKLVNKPKKGHFNKANVTFKKYLKEFKFNDCSSYNIGDEINVDVFNEGDKIDVTGTSKGKGFQGAIRRWNQSRGPMTHGSGFHRGSGSMGAGSSPSRVFKGKRLPGHMGHKQITVQGLSVVKVLGDKNILLIKGAIPGPKGGLVAIKNTVKA